MMKKKNAVQHKVLHVLALFVFESFTQPSTKHNPNSLKKMYNIYLFIYLLPLILICLKIVARRKKGIKSNDL